MIWYVLHHIFDSAFQGLTKSVDGLKTNALDIFRPIVEPIQSLSRNTRLTSKFRKIPNPPLEHHIS